MFIKAFAELIATLNSVDWAARYVVWECALLAALGYRARPQRLRRDRGQ